MNKDRSLYRTGSEKMALSREISRYLTRYAILCVLILSMATPAVALDMVCWFAPGSDTVKCKAITDALTKACGITITPHIADNYPEIFKAFSEKKAALVYAGSFAAALLSSRELATPMVQKIDGKEMYAGIMIYPKGGDPNKIITNYPTEISYAIGASSGESCAKAATQGKAAIGVNDHLSAVNSIKAGKAKAAFVKNFWWDANKSKFPELQACALPGISEKKCPDNLLMASLAVKADVRDNIVVAAISSKDVFGGTRVEPFNTGLLKFPLQLMAKAGINPKTYTW